MKVSVGARRTLARGNAVVLQRAIGADICGNEMRGVKVARIDVSKVMMVPTRRVARRAVETSRTRVLAVAALESVVASVAHVVLGANATTVGAASVWKVLMRDHFAIIKHTFVLALGSVSS